MPGKKRVNRADINEALIRDLIGGQPATPEAEDAVPTSVASGSVLEPGIAPAPRPEPKPASIAVSSEPQQVKQSSRQPVLKKGINEYEHTFLAPQKFKDSTLRATCHVEPDTLKSIQLIVKLLGKQRFSTSALIHNILTHHLETYRDQINELIKNTTKTI